MMTDELKAAAGRLQIYFDVLDRDYIENDHDDPSLRQHIDDGLNVLAALPDLERLRRENEKLWEYRKLMEDAHGSRLYAVEGLLNHFNADGKLLGNGMWRLREIWKMCKIFDAASEKAAKLFDGVELKETGE